MTQYFHFWVYIQKTQNMNSKEHTHFCVHRSIIYNSQDMEATQVPINKWVD